MKITETDQFISICRKKLVEWYKEHINPVISEDNILIISCGKSLKNFKGQFTTNINGDGIYAEYTYNGEKEQLYEDVYKKLTNRCIVDE